MIKNKALDIKIIFKIYLKILKINQKYFVFPNKLLFYKTLYKNYSQKLFFYAKKKNKTKQKYLNFQINFLFK